MKRRTRIVYTEDQKGAMWDRWQQGESMHDIARSFDRYHSCVQQILTKKGGIRPPKSKRPKLCKLNAQPELVSAIMIKLQLKWSPQQIAGWLIKVIRTAQVLIKQVRERWLVN